MRTVLTMVTAVSVVAALNGCADWKVSRPYIGTMQRVDQHLEEGNRGYLVGTPPPVEERKTTRQLITIDVDVPERVSDKSVDTVTGRPGVTKINEAAEVVPADPAQSRRSTFYGGSDIK